MSRRSADTPAPAGFQGIALAIGPVMHIIVMPPHIIIIGMPAFIIAIMRSQHSMNMSFMESLMGIISHFMPVGVMVQVILHIIIGIGGIMPIIGMFIGIFMGIMPPIMGNGIGIMFPIMGMFIGIIVVMAAVIAGLLEIVTARSRCALHKK